MQTPEEYEITERIIKAIEKHKKTTGRTKKQICDLLGIGVTTLSDYANGVSSFRMGTLIKVADLCKFKLGDMIDGTGEFAKELDNVEEKSKQNKTDNKDAKE